MQEQRKLAKRIAELDAERLRILGTPAQYGDHSKSGPLRDLAVQIAALFAQKRALTAARRNASC